LKPQVEKTCGFLLFGSEYLVSGAWEEEVSSQKEYYIQLHEVLFLRTLPHQAAPGCGQGSKVQRRVI
jgi:hypothetical protein